MQKFLVRILLLPFSALYGVVMSMRNGLYKVGLLKSVSFNLPVIGVGNLSLGGAGKTPHVEYLIRLLSPFLEIGILSRGYKRSSKGFKFVTYKDNARTAGDEPFQYFLKFKDVRVAVSESRSIGIPLLLSKFPSTEVILLDDSYQHRSVNPGLNILLTEYAYPYIDDIILPAGRLREWKSSADRADIVIVTKCPEALKPEQKKEMDQRLELEPKQKIFYSQYVYKEPYNLFTGRRQPLSTFPEVILLCAIANEEYLLTYLDQNCSSVHTMIFEDHHYYSPHELSILNQQFKNLGSTSKAIITTEKDATRLILHKEYLIKEDLPIYVLPVEVEFLFGEQEKFNEEVKRFLLNFRV